MQADRSIPTLDDVAKAAGVSTATVSRCLNLPERVAKTTLDRVLKAVKDLGYTPNFGARVMAARRTFTIGAIIPTMENAIFARGLQAFQEELHSHGYTLLVSSSSYRPDVEKDQINALVARGADGLLLIGYDREPEIYKYLEQQKVPVLIAWAFSKDHGQPSIGFDNRNSMCGLADQVIALGHQHIGVISGITDGNDRATQRVEGIRDAIQKVGNDPNDLLVIETDFGIQNGANALDVGALRRAKELGIDVPADLSITGFDDIELAQIVTPALTTVHVPHREMGRKAATELVEMVELRSDGVSIQLDTFLQLRSSLGPASGQPHKSETK
jgi:LacI family transcriptional regulator